MRGGRRRWTSRLRYIAQQEERRERNLKMLEEAREKIRQLDQEIVRRREETIARYKR